MDEHIILLFVKEVPVLVQEKNLSSDLSAREEYAIVSLIICRDHCLTIVCGVV